MAYQPKVVKAQVVSDNPKNGLFELSVVLEDRNHCRVILERDLTTGEIRPTHINRLFKEPCAICKKDFLCSCMDRYLYTIADQAMAIANQ